MRQISKNIPFCLPTVGPDEEKNVIKALRSGWLTKGPLTEKFEKAIKDYTNAKYAIALNSCTSALELSLALLDIKDGDEVITTPNTFAATANVIVHRGAKPVFVDIRCDTLNIDESKIEKAITKRTKAIIPVHFAGQPCEMGKIMRLAKRHKLYVIEDAAHAIGSKYHGKKIGAIGDITCFSFYATKNITTGEGGMITTNDERFAKKARLLSSHGITLDAYDRLKSSNYRHWDTVAAGYKYNMSDIQAAIGLAQIKKLDKFIMARQRLAKIYNDAFGNIPGIIIPESLPGVRHTRHLYTIILKTELLKISRDEMLNKLRSSGIGVGVHYRPLHLHSFYKKTFGYKSGDLPVAEYAGERILSLPLYPLMKPADVGFVANTVKSILAKNNKRKQF